MNNFDIKLKLKIRFFSTYIKIKLAQNLLTFLFKNITGNWVYNPFRSSLKPGDLPFRTLRKRGFVFKYTWFLKIDWMLHTGFFSSNKNLHRVALDRNIYT